jgi:hypothetical protein
MLFSPATIEQTPMCDNNAIGVGICTSSVAPRPKQGPVPHDHTSVPLIFLW